MIFLYNLSEEIKVIECVFLLIQQKIQKNASRGEKWAVTLGAKWADAFDIRRLVRLWCFICRLNNDNRHSFERFDFLDLNV